MELSLEAMAMGLAVANDRYRNAINRGNPIQAERLLRQVEEIESRIERYLEHHRTKGSAGTDTGAVVGK
jgi:hypothetical protein